MLTNSFLKLTSKLRKENHVVDFVATISSAKSILVFMPDKMEDFRIAQKFVHEIEKDFPAAKVDFCTNHSYQEQLNFSKEYGTIFVTSEDISPLGLPKRKLQHKIMATNYDIVIDLNQDFYPISTYLCNKANAVLKICLDEQQREPFYNFRFRINLPMNLEEKYKKLFRYLECFNIPKTALN
ncbi:hypothetical protein B6I21_03750 [candidate division KSB1 bacterium 4572_119]|nr:MAG: hypothetical protein B6I21_03750 [candidate division KSB1 bacterium 4572_119]